MFAGLKVSFQTVIAQLAVPASAGSAWRSDPRAPSPGGSLRRLFNAAWLRRVGEPRPMESTFPVEQACEKGAIAWDEIAAPGIDPHSLAHPAPSLTLHHDGGHEHQH